MSRKQASQRRGRIKKTYNVKEYLCETCWHQFKLAKPLETETCDKCGGTLKIIGSYKSTRPPRGSPPRGQPWFTSDLFYKERPKEQTE